ncbi:MAG: MBL fold metallo-hydrolase [Gemmatimonadota bacterium]
MLFRRFYDEPLAQASYLIGCQATGEALVIDANRDLAPYLAVAVQEGMRIVAVTETHIHADYVSGSRALAAATGARLCLSDDGPEEWRYRFKDDRGFEPLHHGDRITIGKIIAEAVHTPGHTPEHMSFLVTDGAVSKDPMGIVSGDFVFVGDVGRPDLLEKAARVEGASQGSARDLFRSLQWFKTLPDHLQVWPGHGAGSACGKGIGSVPSSTVGYEKRTNWALGIDEESAFVKQVLFGQPEPPAYFGIMKQVNRAGPRVLDGLPMPPVLHSGRLPELLRAGATVVDLRLGTKFAEAHVPGTITIPFNRGFATYAGSVLPYHQDLYLLADSEESLAGAVRSLLMIGLDRILGSFGAESIATESSAGGTTDQLPMVSAEEACRRVDQGAVFVDVRGESEWRDGHLEVARLVPLPELPARLEEIPRDQPVLVFCQAGSRSAIATSLLRAKGWSDVTVVIGGYPALSAVKRPAGVS